MIVYKQHMMMGKNRVFQMRADIKDLKNTVKEKSKE